MRATELMEPFWMLSPLKVIAVMLKGENATSRWERERQRFPLEQMSGVSWFSRSVVYYAWVAGALKGYAGETSQGILYERGQNNTYEMRGGRKEGRRLDET